MKICHSSLNTLYLSSNKNRRSAMEKHKNISFLFIIFFTLFAGTFLCACDNNTIKIIGDFEQTVEVKTAFHDQGVSCSSDCNVITEGEVNTNIIERYQLIYKVYSKDGELLKELSRYVNVVDTTAPTYVINTSATYYAGISYNINDFISYSDNYDSKENIQTGFTNKTFTEPGNHLITIKLRDSSNNESTFSGNVNVVLDLDRTVRNVYQNNLSKITTSYPDSQGTYTHVSIDSNTSLGYRDTGYIGFIKFFDLSNGNHASIQISATQYGKFNNATISYNVRDSFHPDVYSVGFANIDATRQYTNLTISQFTSINNNIPINEDVMLADCNATLLNVLNEFQNYMTNTLHITIQ